MASAASQVINHEIGNFGYIYALEIVATWSTYTFSVYEPLFHRYPRTSLAHF